MTTLFFVIDGFVLIPVLLYAFNERGREALSNSYYKMNWEYYWPTWVAILIQLFSLLLVLLVCIGISTITTFFLLLIYKVIVWVL